MAPGHTQGVAPLETERATLLSLDASLGVAGLPQSATGQAALVTGKNVSQMIGEHYGPKPNKAVAEIVRLDNLFIQLTHPVSVPAVVLGLLSSAASDQSLAKGFFRFRDFVEWRYRELSTLHATKAVD